MKKKSNQTTGGTAPAQKQKPTPDFLSVHRVGYIALNTVQERHGKQKMEMLVERLQYAGTAGTEGQCSLETLADNLDGDIEAGNITKADAKWMKQFIADCVAAGAHGDLIWSY